MVDAGLIVLVVVHLAVPRRSAGWPASWSATASSVEVFVDTPLGVAEAPRPQGPVRQGPARRAAQLHRHRRPYEAPETPDVHLRTTEQSAEDAADLVIEHLLGG